MATPPPAPEKTEPEKKPEKEATEKPAKSKPESGGSGGGEEAVLTLGKTTFTSTCAGCHTLSEAGTTGSVGPNLDDLMPDEMLVIHQVTNGGGGMPAFGNVLSKQEIEAVAKYVSTVAGTGNDTLGGKSTGGGGGP